LESNFSKAAETDCVAADENARYNKQFFVLASFELARSRESPKAARKIPLDHFGIDASRLNQLRSSVNSGQGAPSGISSSTTSSCPSSICGLSVASRSQRFSLQQIGRQKRVKVRHLV
jgi:hypothetical protein